MSSPDPVGIVASAAIEAVKNGLTKDSDSKTSWPLNLSKAVVVVRIETDDFEVCHAKIIPQRKLLFGEKKTLVHLKDNEGNFKIVPLP
jgi:hypothetical protein